MKIDFVSIQRYEMHFKQRVTTEDVFLQMGNKNCASASCEDLVVGFCLSKRKIFFSDRSSFSGQHSITGNKAFWNRSGRDENISRLSLSEIVSRDEENLNSENDSDFFSVDCCCNCRILLIRTILRRNGTKKSVCWPSRCEWFENSTISTFDVSFLFCSKKKQK